MYHGGKFNWQNYRYIDGHVDYVDLCDAKTMSVHEINYMVDKLGYYGCIVYYYLEPGKDFQSGLKELSTDKAIISFCNWAYKHKIIEVYCDHKTKNEIKRMAMKSLPFDMELIKKPGVTIEELDENGNVIRERSFKLVPLTRLFDKIDAENCSRENVLNNGDDGDENDKRKYKWPSGD